MKLHIETLLFASITSLKIKDFSLNDIKVERCKDKTHGDFASNIALILSKSLKKSPRDVAKLIIENLPEVNSIVKVEIAGPGFINFFVSNDLIISELHRMLSDLCLGNKAETPQRVVIDYSSPNLAKEMHVGHLRSTIIGDSLARILEYLGHNVIRQNHVGDWGTQFGMLLALMEDLNPDSVEFELSSLEDFYREAKLRFDASDAFASRSRELVVKLQAHDPYCIKLWKKFNNISLTHCSEVYQNLGVSLTMEDVKGESSYNEDLSKVVEDLASFNLLEDSDGAKVVFLDGFVNKEGDVLPVIIQKADGGYLYSTTDLAAIRYRSEVLKADRILYIVDMRQSLHFEQIFALAKKANFVKEHVSLEHLGFGTMNGKDGKPFKTRTGGVVKLASLLDEAKIKAYDLVLEKNPTLSALELKHIADVVAIDSIKYADLCKNRTSDYIFSFEQMLNFDGNTAPYLLYAYTRVQGLFKKVSTFDNNAVILLDTEKELELAKLLVQFGETLDIVAAKGLPHLLCSYLFKLAVAFSSFYESCPILNAEEDIRNSRLLLAKLTAKTLQHGLNLLGIKTLEQM